MKTVELKDQILEILEQVFDHKLAPSSGTLDIMEILRSQNARKGVIQFDDAANKKNATVCQ